MSFHIAQTRNVEPAFPINDMRIARDIYVPAIPNMCNAVIVDNDYLPFQYALAIQRDDVHVFKDDRYIK